jgi:hypothetical protein
MNNDLEQELVQRREKGNHTVGLGCITRHGGGTNVEVCMTWRKETGGSEGLCVR